MKVMRCTGICSGRSAPSVLPRGHDAPRGGPAPVLSWPTGQNVREVRPEMRDNVLDVHRRALSDYRIALGLELRSRRTNADYSIEKLASLSDIPAETLRSYEKGASLPRLVRLVTIAKVYGLTVFDILESTAEYIYRSSGGPAHHQVSDSVDKATLHAVVLYCGVTPIQLRMMETRPRSGETISEDLFRE